MNSSRSVSIIIPVFKDWSSLETCLASCNEFVGDQHEIIIIYDAGTEPQLREQILDFIKGKVKFSFFENETNLGFTQTCNKGVREYSRKDNDILLLNSDTQVTEGFLEEMQHCLYAFEKNAVCCPRSNNATILSVPMFNGGRDQLNPQKSYECWMNTKDLMPRMSTIPTGMGFCMLIRRSVVNNLELFDVIYGRGYNEENDFCSRINQYGYSAVVSNRSFVFHHGTRSFTENDKQQLHNSNKQILEKRYPEYNKSVNKYCQWQINAVDNFSALLGDTDRKKRILIDISHFIPVHNGTSEYVLELLKELHPILTQKFDVHISVNETANSFFGVDKMFSRVFITVNFSLEQKYDLIYTPYQVFEPENLFMLNRSALRFVVGILDIISVRSHYLHDQMFEVIDENLIKYADGLIFISQSVIEDVNNYFNTIKKSKHQMREAILPTKSSITDDKMISHHEDEILKSLPSEFVLVIGNQFKHKSVDLALNHIGGPTTLVVLGGTETGWSQDRKRLFLKSGIFSNEFVDALCGKCKILLFPSQYEGYGLPIVSAFIHKKPLIVFNSEVSREVTDSLGIRHNVHFFENFSELDSLISSIDAETDYPQLKRSWKTVALENAEFLEKVLRQEVQVERLSERFSNIKNLEYVYRNAKMQSTDAHTKYGIKDIVYAYRLLRREGIKSFVNRLFWYIRGKRHITDIKSFQ